MCEISIITSVYNGEKEIEKTIECILNQTFKDFEWIIIDDYSKDNTAIIIEKYTVLDSRIKLIKNKMNNGLEGYINNLNTLISLAKGKYIAKIDQDDLHELNKLELQYNFLENNPHIYLLGSNAYKIDLEGNIIGELNRPETHESIVRLARTENSVNHPTFFFRNDYSIKYRSKMFYCEDYDFVLNAISKGKLIHNLKDKLLYYRVSPNSMNHKKNTLVKWLFLEKARIFYRERIKYGKDTYNNFNPKDYLNIEDRKIKTPKHVLYEAMHVSVKTYRLDILSQLINKYKQHYNHSIKSTFYSTFLIQKKISTFLIKVYKLYSKLKNQWIY